MNSFDHSSQDIDLASLALRALLYEVVVNPKPGLVDPVSTGAHQDMDVFTFLDSSVSLRHYFEKLVELGRSFSGEDLTELFAQIRPIGVQAEKKMFQATKGINTHKGAIFSLGVLVTATAYQSKNARFSAEKVSETVKRMLKALTKKDFEHLESKKNLTAGEKQFLNYGITGIRGEAEAGFPSVIMISLPFLKTTKGSRNERLLDTLMYIAGHIKDSNLIKRAGGIEILAEMREKCEQYFAPETDKRQFLLDLDREFIERNLSLGGSADLLILTIFLALLEEEI